MAVPYVKVKWYPSDSSTAIEITDAIKWDVRKGLEVKNSTVTIPLKNNWYTHINTASSDEYQGEFDIDDVIKIYAAWTSITEASSQLLLHGEITKLKTKYDHKTNSITITAVDRTALILNQMWAKEYSNKTAPEIIKNAIDHSAKDKFTFTNFTTSSGRGWGTEDGRADGSDFPQLTLGFGFKPVYEWIQELSGIQNTNTGTELENGTNPIKRTMMFWIGEDNDIHWTYPKDAAITTLNEDLDLSEETITLTDASDFESSGIISIGNEQIAYTGKSTNDLTGCTRSYNNTTAATHSIGDTVYEALVFSSGIKPYITQGNFEKSVFDTINMIIMRLGKDLNGNNILWYKYNAASASSNLKIKIMDWAQVSDELRGKYISTQTTTSGATAVDANTVNLTDASEFNSAGTAMIVGNDGHEIIEYTGKAGNSLTGVSRNQHGTAARAFDSGVIIKDITALFNLSNDQFVAELKEKGEKKANVILTKLGNARWKGNLEVMGNRYTPGDLCRVTIPSIGFNGKLLRLMDISHNITKSMWFTSLELEEDEEAISQQGG